MCKTLLHSLFTQRNRLLLLSIIFALSCLTKVTAQTDSQIVFQDDVITMTRNIETFQWSEMPETSYFNNGYYGWLEFSQTPTQAIQESFKANGLELLDYIPNRTYLFYFPASTDINYLESVGVQSIIPVSANMKLSSRIKNDDIGEWALDGNRILVNIQYHKRLESTFVANAINTISSLTIREDYKNSNIMKVAVAKADMEQLVGIPFIKWVELISEPPVKEDDKGRSIHRASNLDTQTMSGRNYTGEGIGVMVRDDGIVGPHIDFQGRIDNSLASGTGQTHGDGVAGILSGAGNLDPTKRGMAAGSDVYIVNYASSFLDAATTGYINNGDVQITNSSYGDGCNAGYTTVSQTVDTQINNNPSLLHVFSAGNSNGNDCGYGAGNQWGNITGGHKQGKNVIATANVFSDGSLASSSSHGPAYDGRIKPDITAHGQGQLSTDENNTYLSFGGTSGASPGIAGVSAQLYQAYMENNAGAKPESALIKATLLNTANDYGNVGPDFMFGWGLVNGLRAVKLLEEDRFLDDNVTQGVTNNHLISVPANTKQVRFMLYWNDPAATSGAATALVNDLDLKVTDPSNTELLPWILDSTPNPTLLDLPATNGVDRLNNMEQVLINNPAAGNYDIDITGFNVPSGAQHYFIVYEIVTDNLVLTYPQGEEKMVAGSQEVIHWDAINTTDVFNIEYSTDNGGSWLAAGTAPSTATNFTWSVPNLVSGECLVRITSGSFSYTMASTFSISNLVTGVGVSQICPETVAVTWDALPDVSSYDVYILGDKYMENVGNSTTNSLTVTITDPNEDLWVAVSANGTTGWKSRRSIAVFQAGGLFNCSLNDDLTVESLNNDFTNLQVVCGDSGTIMVSANVRNLGQNDQTSGFLVSYQLDTESVVEETYSGTLNVGSQITHVFATPLNLTTDGSHTLKVWVTLAGDEFVANDELETMFYTQVNPTGFDMAQTFEGTSVPPEGWTLDNPDGSYTWQEATGVIGTDGVATTTVFSNNAVYTATGQLDILSSSVYDLTGSNVELSFDLAKAQWSASYNDALHVEISTDCGATFTNIYNKDGLTLSTIPSYVGSNWTPATGADWRKETISLAAYEGNSQVVIRFINVNGYSNSTFIDNINVTGETLSVADRSLSNELALFPNPADNQFTIRLSTSFLKSVKIYDLFGKEVIIADIKDLNQRTLNIDTSKLASGIYVVGVKTETAIAHKKLIIK